MFQKDVLSLSPACNKRTKKSKKRIGERLSAHRQKDFSVKTQLHSLSDNENSKTRSRPEAAQPVKSRLTEKLRSLKSSKGKSSEVVGRRRALSVIQSPRGRSAVGPSSPKKLEKDLQRVLGHDSKPNSNVTSNSTRYVAEKKRECELPSSPDSDSACSLSEMDVTPKGSPERAPLKSIADRLSGSLRTDLFFPNSNYLSDVKEELRKVMKQSDPQQYKELLSLLSHKNEQSLKNTDDDEASSFNIQPSNSNYSMCDDSDCLSSLALLSSSDATDQPPPLHHIPSPPLAAVQPQTIEPAAVLLIDTVNEVNTSAPTDVCTMADTQPNSMCTASSSLDFLDLVERSSSSKSMSTEYATEGGNPSSRWLPTPDRPRMFPRKLY